MTSKIAYCLFGSGDDCASTLANIQNNVAYWQTFDFFGNNLQPGSTNEFPFVDFQYQNIQQEVQDSLALLSNQGWKPHNVLSLAFVQMIYSLSYVAAQVRHWQETTDQDYDRFVFQHWNTRYLAPVDIGAYQPCNVLSNHSLGANRFSQLWMMLDKQAFLTLDQLFDSVLKLSADPGRYWFVPGELVFLFLESHGLQFDLTWHPMQLTHCKITPTARSLV